MTQDADSLAEQIDRAFPNRHPFPVKCLLWLVFKKTQRVPFKFVTLLAQQMGWRQMVHEQNIGGGLVFIQQGWYDTTGLTITGVEQ